MRTNKTIIGYKALKQDFTGKYGESFPLYSVHELPNCTPQAGKHGYTFATSMHRLFQCFDTSEMPIVVEVTAYGETHIGRHLCATNRMVITRVLGYHEIHDLLQSENAETTLEEESEGTDETDQSDGFFTEAEDPNEYFELEPDEESEESEDFDQIEEELNQINQSLDELEEELEQESEDPNEEEEEEESEPDKRETGFPETENGKERETGSAEPTGTTGKGLLLHRMIRKLKEGK